MNLPMHPPRSSGSNSVFSKRASTRNFRIEILPPIAKSRRRQKYRKRRDTLPAKNPQRGSQMDERKRDSMVAYLRRRMAQVGIKVGDLATALADDRMRQKSALYRSAFNEAWDGKGEMPQWLKQATSAGQSLEHFAVKRAAAAARRPTTTAADWRQDPFAGTRLATVRA
jgi:DNA-binding protein H-NS